jgi:hypothetical protein
LDYASDKRWENNLTKGQTKPITEIEIIEDRDEDIYPDIKNLPFGSIVDCIDSMCLSCIWSNLSEDIIVDTGNL